MSSNKDNNNNNKKANNLFARLPKEIAKSKLFFTGVTQDKNKKKKA